MQQAAAGTAAAEAEEVGGTVVAEGAAAVGPVATAHAAVVAERDMGSPGAARAEADGVEEALERDIVVGESFAATGAAAALRKHT